MKTECSIYYSSYSSTLSMVFKDQNGDLGFCQRLILPFYIDTGSCICHFIYSDGFDRLIKSPNAGDHFLCDVYGCSCTLSLHDVLLPVFTPFPLGSSTSWVQQLQWPPKLMRSPCHTLTRAKVMKSKSRNWVI